MSHTLAASPDELRERFAELKTRQDVADLLEIDLQLLKYYLYILPDCDRYTSFGIPKRSGGVRNISAPASALKIVQQKLNQVLKVVYQPKPSVHGFVAGQSIVSNAERHVRRRYVLKVDLADFFPSIHFGRVRGLFRAKPYEIGEEAATVLAQICCHEGKLPQGAPTSPIVSNMICAKMDRQLQDLAKKHRWRYTRYADDLTFSTKLRKVPEELAGIGTFGQIEVGGELSGVIAQNKFKVNPDKVRLRSNDRRQEVTGLLTNQVVNVRRKYTNQIRAMLHAWEQYGLEAAEQEFRTLHDRKHRGSFNHPPLFKHVVKGKIEFLGMVRGRENAKYLDFCRQLRKLAPELVSPPPLLKMYEDLAASEATQERGYMLERLLLEMFDLHEISVKESFRRNEGAEQIDGAFEFKGWYYIVECRWRKKLADISELGALKTKVDGSGPQTMGFFLSINGWSDNVPKLLKQKSRKDTVLMDGDDLRSVLSEEIALADFLEAKRAKLNLEVEAFYSAEQYLKDHA